MYMVDKLYRIDDLHSNSVAWVRFERKLTEEEEDKFIEFVRFSLNSAVDTDFHGLFSAHVQKACHAFAITYDICGYVLSSVPFRTLGV